MTMRMRRTVARFPIIPLLLVVGSCVGSPALTRPVAVAAPQAAAPPAAAAPAATLPNTSSSLKFGVLGDFGTGKPPEYELAAEMAKVYAGFKLELVVTVGDNLYGAERPQDFKLKFEDPYKPLLDAGVKFYASLGNHDARTQPDYKPFNMGGKLYYSFKAPKGRVRFFMLDSTYPVPEEIAWVENELKSSSDDWKVAVFHHPLYSSGGRHGSDVKLRETLEPLFIKYNVSVVLTGHDHFYERIKPQHGIAYFVAGSGGQLAAGDIDKNSSLTAKGFDTDQAFLAVEISGDTMTFNAISRQGRVVDSGTLERRRPQ
jgi:calcineurin-like phosphoesterase family protein